MSNIRHQINSMYRQDESLVVRALLEQADFSDATLVSINTFASQLVESVRNSNEKQSLVSQLMSQFPLSSSQGLNLMSMAEALLRIPDVETANKMIAGKLSNVAWSESALAKKSLIQQLSGKALDAAGAILEEGSTIKNLAKKTSMPIMRAFANKAMTILGDEFVLGTTIQNAQERSKQYPGYFFSYDMLGEAALTPHDAERYFESYLLAIDAMAGDKSKSVFDAPSISVKLSALHPRYGFQQRSHVVRKTAELLVQLALKCQEKHISLTVDAEEADVLDVSLDIFELVHLDQRLKGWNGLGLAVQAYQKRATAVIDWAIELAEQKMLHVRLVKGAYWDTEIKRAQERGLNNYPVFTRKPYTDLSYIVCAKKLLGARQVLYPMFATHNAHTVATIMTLSENLKGFEFQRLHGMGSDLYANIIDRCPCRVYAPVGSHNDLLPYLVRRLLENGANTSFVHNIVDPNIPVESLIRSPIEFSKLQDGNPHPQIPLPREMFGVDRKNSAGLDLSDDVELQPLYDYLKSSPQPIQVKSATPEDVKLAFDKAEKAFDRWNATAIEERATILEKAAELIESNKVELMALCINEAGKTIPDAIAEIREAADFCRYYAARGRHEFAPKVLTGPTGELNQLTLYGRGTFVCISPWNFPLAIFLGQVTAALMSGNCVLAKPAEPTPQIAKFAIDLLHKAGIPEDVLHFLPGSARSIGSALIEDPRVCGIAMTGSVATAQHINKQLAARNGSIVPLIAETGGQNVMIVDSSALKEQVVKDIIVSSFQSAGQRCSALRVLLVQEEIADGLIEMLSGAMSQLLVSDPAKLTTDVGPVINQAAQTELNEHKQYLRECSKLIYECELDDTVGTFVAPAAFEIDSLDRLRGEKFGPILHVLRYRAKDLDNVIDQVNAMGFGLTLGIHSRVQENIDLIVSKAKVGNVYVNRNMIGAVVGVQPFGGEGLSGTGPKAGGPHYLARMSTERTLCVNTTAQGGNATLMAMNEE